MIELNKTDTLRAGFYFSLLMFEEWIVQWTILMLREWDPVRYPETME